VTVAVANAPVSYGSFGLAGGYLELPFHDPERLAGARGGLEAAAARCSERGYQASLHNAACSVPTPTSAATATTCAPEGSER
jgi:hypothetical protein